jgi:hypothetical protein
VSLEVRKTRRSLVFSGSILVAFNVVVNILDLTTTFIGFRRGLPEQNFEASFLMKVVGNEYLGAIILKAFFLSFFALAYYSMRGFEKKDERRRGLVFGMLFLDFALIFTALWITEIVVGNLVALGVIGA